MKRVSTIFLAFFVIFLVSLLFSSQTKTDLLRAKYLVYLAQQRSRRELAIFEALTEKEGFMRKATDYLKFSESYKKIHEERQKILEKLNKLRAKGDLNSIEYYETLAQSYNLLAMENKQLIAEMEKGFYDSYMYTIEEFVKGSWADIEFIANELWGKIGDIIAPLLEGDFGGFIKNVIMETVDATFKVRFVNFYKDKATEKIATYWWDHYIMNNLNKTETQKLIEDIVNKGKDELKEKLEKSVKEDIKNKLIESGKKLTKDEIKKEAEKAAEKFVKNLVEFPALLVEIIEKYYSVYTFFDLFQQVAPNELNYVEQIKAVLKELNMLDEYQINNCYWDKVYFMNLRKRLKKKVAPKPQVSISKETIDPKYKIDIKPSVKSRIDVEVKIAEEFVDEMDKLENQDVYLNKFDVNLFTRLIDKSEQTLRENAIDYKLFLKYTDEISSKFNEALNGWYESSLKSIENSTKSYTEKEEEKSRLKKDYEGYKREFGNYLSSTRSRLENEMNSYQQKIKDMVSSFDIRDEVDSLDKGILERCKSFVNELNERYKFACNISSFYGDMEPNFADSTELIEFLSFTGVSKDILRPNSGLFFKLSRFFVTELYSIWKDDYDETQKLLSSANEYKIKLEDLLAKDDWRIYYQDEKGLKMYEPVRIALDSFYKRSKLKWLAQRLEKLSNKKGSVEGFIKKFEASLIESRVRIYIFESTTKGRIRALEGILSEVERLMHEVETGYVSAWKDYLVKVVQVIVDLYYGKITPDIARQNIENLDSQVLVEEMIYKREVINALLNEAADLWHELYDTKKSGFFNLKTSLEIYEKKFGKSAISPEEVDFEGLKKEIEKVIEKYHTLFGQSENLNSKIMNVFIQDPWFFTQFVETPDNGYMKKLFDNGNWVEPTYMVDENDKWTFTINIKRWSLEIIEDYLEEEEALKKANEYFARKLSEMESKVLEFVKNPTDSERKNELFNELNSMHRKFNEIYANNYEKASSYHPTLLKKELNDKWSELWNKLFNVKPPIRVEVATPKISSKTIKRLKPKRISRMYFDYKIGYPFSVEFSLDNSNLVVGIENDWYLLNIKKKKYTNLNAQVLLEPFSKNVGPFVILRLPMIYQLEKNKYFVFNDESGIAGIWEPGKEPEVFLGESFPNGGAITSISSDRRYLLLKKGVDKSTANIYTYDMKTGNVLGKVVSSFSSVSSWIPGGTDFVCFEPFTTKTLQIYRIDGSMIKELELPKDKEYFNTIAPLFGGKYVLLISERDGVVALDTETGKLSKLKLKLGKNEFPETVFSSFTEPYFGVIFGRHSESGYQKGLEIYQLK
jgi:hypothetical protein